MTPSTKRLLAALATRAVGCASSVKQVGAIDTANATGDRTRSLAGDVTTAPLTARELAALRQSPTILPAADPSGVARLITTPARWDSFLAGASLR